MHTRPPPQRSSVKQQVALASMRCYSTWGSLTGSWGCWRRELLAPHLEAPKRQAPAVTTNRPYSSTIEDMFLKTM